MGPSQPVARGEPSPTQLQHQPTRITSAWVDASERPVALYYPAPPAACLARKLVPQILCLGLQPHHLGSKLSPASCVEQPLEARVTNLYGTGSAPITQATMAVPPPPAHLHLTPAKDASMSELISRLCAPAAHSCERIKPTALGQSLGDNSRRR